MAQHTVLTASGHRDYFRRLLVCIFATILVNMIFFLFAKTEWQISALREAINQSQNEIILFLLFCLTYFAGFASSRRWSLCAGTVLKVMGPRPPSRRTPSKVTVGPTKTSAEKIILPTAKKIGQWDIDTHLIKTTDRECLPSDAAKFLTLVGACARLNNAEMTLDLFDHMLKNGFACDQKSINNGTASKFFKLVAQNLGDNRMQKDGTQLMRTILAHGLLPTNFIQNQLIRSWRSKLPVHVVEVFVDLREKGVHLSATAYRCIMAAYERTEPVFTLLLYDEMLERGIKIDRVAFNAVLCACSHLGMTNRALGLFKQMSQFELVPNGKTYGTLIRACTSTNMFKEALELYESMRAEGMEPNRFAFCDAIHCCVKLRNLEKAYELYKDLAGSGVPSNSTRMYIMEACQKNGCPSVADRIQADMDPMGRNDAKWVEDFKAFAHAIGSDTE
jgi:pentatricopeptide repeat protein